MSNKDELPDGLKLADQATLKLLTMLEDDRQPTQRALAQQIGVALGMTNGLIKRAVRKGLLKVKEAPAKRYAYYVTPKGFSEKGRLVAEYIGTSLSFFRHAREEFTEIYDQVRAAGCERVVLLGAGELAEVANYSAYQSDIKVCGIIESGSNQPVYAGLPVYASITAALADNADAVVITGSADPQGLYEEVIEHIDPQKVFAVPLLHISRNVKNGKKRAAP